MRIRVRAITSFVDREAAATATAVLFPVLSLALSQRERRARARNNINPYYNIPYVRLTGLVRRRSSTS